LDSLAHFQLYYTAKKINASGLELHSPAIDWPHASIFGLYDHASLRRGFQVYRQVCSACHSLDRMKFRNFVGVTHTEVELKELSKEYIVQDENPNDEGKMFTRPGKINDPIPGPYANKQAARAANNGALPPDMSLMRHSKTHGDDGHMGEDYMFHLLTGYCPAPAGIELAENQYFNPYFVGGAIGMAPPLYSEILEYEDGTPATLSQLSSDVVQFLTFCSEPEREDKILAMNKALPIVVVMLIASIVWKRTIFAGAKTTQVSWKHMQAKKK